MSRLLATVAVPLVLVMSSTVAAAETAPKSAMLEWTADTTFTPEGSYTLDVTIEGEAFKMAFTVAKKPDGTWGGLFKNDDIGDYPTKSFKLEGRTMTMTIETPGGPAMIVLTVKADQTVEGEWSGAGDGSKITGKKVS